METERITYKELYKVEDIVDHKFVYNGSIQYRVKWVGYKSSEDTWEPPLNLENVSELVDNYNERMGLPVFEFSGKQRLQKQSTLLDLFKRHPLVEKRREMEKPVQIKSEREVCRKIVENKEVGIVPHKRKDNPNPIIERKRRYMSKRPKKMPKEQTVKKAGKMVKHRKPNNMKKLSKEIMEEMKKDYEYLGNYLVHTIPNSKSKSKFNPHGVITPKNMKIYERPKEGIRLYQEDVVTSTQYEKE